MMEIVLINLLPRFLDIAEEKLMKIPCFIVTSLYASNADAYLHLKCFNSNHEKSSGFRTAYCLYIHNRGMAFLRKLNCILG